MLDAAASLDPRLATTAHLYGWKRVFSLASAETSDTVLYVVVRDPSKSLCIRTDVSEDMVCRFICLAFVFLLSSTHFLLMWIVCGINLSHVIKS